MLSLSILYVGLEYKVKQNIQQIPSTLMNQILCCFWTTVLTNLTNVAVTIRATDTNTYRILQVGHPYMDNNNDNRQAFVGFIDAIGFYISRIETGCGSTTTTIPIRDHSIHYPFEGLID